MSLQEWEEKLDGVEFYRLNRSTIISWRYVQSVKDKIEMVNGEFHRIPAGKKKLVREKHFQYVRNKFL